MSNSSSFIVAIDTSSRRGSIALAVNGRLAAVYGLETDAPQSAGLWENVDMLMVRAGRTVRDVTAIAVACGPGSFTGLRVGIAAATGLARALDRPLYGATTLELVARSSGACEDVWAVLDARRSEVFAQRFVVGGDGSVRKRSEPSIETPETLVRQFDESGVRVVADPAAGVSQVVVVEADRRAIALATPAVTTALVSGWQYVEAPSFLAGELALLAGTLEAAGTAPAPVAACYVRLSQAEVNRRAANSAREAIEGGR